MSVGYFGIKAPVRFSVSCMTVGLNACHRLSSSRVAWLPFSCSSAKSYISEGPVRHVGFQFCYPAKKCRKKKLTLLQRLGRSHGGIPARLVVTQAESRLRKGLSFWDTLQFLNQTAGTACRLCVLRQQPTLGSALV